MTRNLKCLWTSQLLSQVADSVTKLALLWFVYSVTGSAFKTTLIGLLQTISSIVCTPFIGLLVDRLPKKAILIVTDLLRGVFLGLIPWLLPSNGLTVDMLYVLVFLYGLVSAVFTPALSASIPFLTSPKQFTAGNALLQSTTSIGIILGPVMSGIGIAALGAQEVLALNTVTYVASAVLLLPLRFAKDSRPLPAPTRNMSIALLDGLRFTFKKSPPIVRLIVIASTYTFGTAALTTLLPVFGRSIFHLGPVEVGYLWSSLGAGFLLISMALLRVSEWSIGRKIRLIAVSSTIAGVALIALLFAQELLAAIALMAIVGMGLGTLTPIAWGILQELAPLSMLGRVMGFYTTVAMTTSLLGMWFFGWVTQSVSEVSGLTGIAVVLLLAGAISFAFASRIGAARRAVGSRLPSTRPDVCETDREAAWLTH